MNSCITGKQGYNIEKNQNQLCFKTIKDKFQKHKCAKINVNIRKFMKVL